MNDDFQDLMEAGWQKMQSGQNPEAEQTFQIAGRLFPYAGAPHTSLGFLYLGQRRWDEARQEFEIAAQIDPRNAYNFVGLARAYHGQGRDAEYALILQIQDDTPRNAGPREIGLAISAGHRGDLAAALHHYRRAQEWFPDSMLLVELIGETLLRLHQTTEVRDLLDRATRRPGVTFRVYVLLGEAERRLGNFRAALEAFQQAEARSPDHLVVLLRLTTLELRLGQWRSAGPHFRRLCKQGWTAFRQAPTRPVEDPPAFRALSPAAKKAYLRQRIRSNAIFVTMVALLTPLGARYDHLSPGLFFVTCLLGACLGHLIVYLYRKMKRRRR